MRRWVVVGGGAAGCVVAARLSERPDVHVTLIEAGPDHGAEAPADDVGPYLSDPARMRVEQVVRRPGAAPEPYWQGRGLGGSSIINGSVVTGPTPPRSPVDVPTEPPWATGAVGAALLAADDRAAPVLLVRRDRRRLTAADLYLRPVLDRGNLEVHCDAPVRSVRLDRRRAVGVELDDGSAVHADCVVLCAGAIRTPTLLLRSGVDTPGIGDRLQDHPAFTITLRLRERAIDPMTPTISVSAVHDHHQVHALDHLPGAPGLGALTIGLLDVASEGVVRLGEDGEPRVELGLLTGPVDRARMVDGVVESLVLLDHPAWSDVVEEAFVDDVGTPAGELMSSPERVGPWVVGHVGSHHHVSGSCRAGVVTDDGSVRGYSGLYVADASVLPGVPRLDPYLAVLREAGRLAGSW